MKYWFKWPGSLAAIIWSALFYSSICMAGGGKFSESASHLSSSIYGRLIEGGICITRADCNKKEIFFGDHDLAVSFYFYGLVNNDVALTIIHDAIEFSAKNKVPVDLYFYEDHKSELSGMKKFFKKPRIEVEINI